MVRRKTMALLGTQPALVPDGQAAQQEKDGVTTEVETVRASESDQNSQPAMSEGKQLHGKAVSKQGSRTDVPKPTLGAVPPQGVAGLPEVDHTSDAADPQATTVPANNKGISFL